MSDKPKTIKDFFDIEVERVSDIWNVGYSAAVEATRQEMQAEIDKRDARIEEASDYCAKHLWKGEMWSAVIYGMLNDCDFRESENHFKKLTQEKDERNE